MFATKLHKTQASRTAKSPERNNALLKSTMSGQPHGRSTGEGPVKKITDDAVLQASERLREMRVDEGRVPRALEAYAHGSPSASSTPVRIASPSPARFARGRGRQRPVDDDDEERLDFEQVRKVSERNRRRKESAKVSAAQPGIIVRGFQTPAASGGEDSDASMVSTPRMLPRTGDLPSVTSSPALRPMSQGGISALRQQFGSLSLDAVSLGRPHPIRMGSGLRSDFSGSEVSSDSDRMDLESRSYSVNLEHDFVGRTGSGSRTPTTPSGTHFPEQAETPAHKMTADDFEPIKCLGKGSYGTVLLVRQRSTGRLFAQKQLRKAFMMVHGTTNQAKSERQILESVNRHPFVVKLYYAFQDHEKLYLLLQYAQGGELFHHLATNHMFNEEHAAFYMAEVVLALEHLHRTVGVVYRDLKPENVLLDADGHVLLTDFGLSKVAVDDDATCSSIVGTCEYMAPEVVRGERYSFAVDWWSLGALGCELMTGNSPFAASNRRSIEDNILRKKFAPPYYLSADAKDLLLRLLRKKPRDRLGANMPRDLATIKKHRFFRNIDWCRLARRDVDPPIRPFISDPALAENFSTDFTTLALGRSGLLAEKLDAACGDVPLRDGDADAELFGGFSYTASSSLLEAGVFGF